MNNLWSLPACVAALSCTQGGPPVSASQAAASQAPSPPEAAKPAATTHKTPTASASAANPAARTNGKHSPAPRKSKEAKNAAGKAPHDFQAPVPGTAELLKGTASELSNLSPAACRRRLRRLTVPFERNRRAYSGVATPLSVAPQFPGIALRAPQGKFGVLDCRLALTLHSIFPLLAKHDVKSLRIDNFYRNRARLPGRKKPSQHSYGLAADVVSFTLKNGDVLDIETDWGGKIGDEPCGPKASVVPETDKGVRLRNLYCDVARHGFFHHMLSPNHNRAHRNHLHLDIKRGNRWYSID